MAVSDKELMQNLGLSQSDVARLLKTSRQTVNAGIKREDLFLNSIRLLLLYKGLRAESDIRGDVVAEILSKHGFDLESGAYDILDLQISDKHIHLISNNSSLKEYLRQIISDLIKTECEKLEYLLRKE